MDDLTMKEALDIVLELALRNSGHYPDTAEKEAAALNMVGYLITVLFNDIKDWG